MNSSKTALLIFTRTAASEARQKCFLGNGSSQNQNLTLANELIAKTKLVAARSGLHVIVSTDFNQKGKTFGKRLSTAIAETFAKGYDKIVAVGTDTPALSTAHIHTAVKALHNQNLVLGPSTDGGVYLIGIIKGAFDPHTFQSLPWLTGAVYHSLVAEANTLGQAIVSLETLSDIDDLEGLMQSVGELDQADSFLKLLLQFISLVRRFPINNPSLPSLYRGESTALRAPPTC